jgi:hypothetical protein
MCREPTPVDTFSGVPLPLAPIEGGSWPTRQEITDNHAWHGKKHEPLLLGIGGEALRSSRVQEVDYARHTWYHDNFRGPDLPGNDEERLRPIILAAAGYVPDRAISFDRNGEPRLVKLPPEIREEMWSTGEIRLASPLHVRNFLCDYLLNRDLPAIKPDLIREFLNTRDDVWRLKLGNGFLRLMTRRVMEPMEGPYLEAYRTERIYPPRHAQTVTKFVAGVLLHPEYHPRAHQKLRNRLVVA